MNGSLQYKEKEAIITLSVISALVKSLAVISIKIFSVVSLSLECSPLMIGGKDNTTLLESYIIG